ncbi:MAG: hypothetical protein QGI93_10810, partial [Planctomycetota bacterium]|nr:hypothetical protein [Planctomycetota bacterium]
MTTHRVHDAKLRFQLKGVDQVFKVHAKSTEYWYAILDAAETQGELTVRTRPAVLEGRGWPFVPFTHSQPWQVEHEGKVLLSYRERAAKSESVKLVSGIAFLLSIGALGWWLVRITGPDAEPRPVRRRKSREAAETEESESTSDAMPKAARWFWDLFGALILVAVVGSAVMSKFDRDTPIPAATELVEVGGVVVDVQVETSGGHGTGSASAVEKIAGFSFELKGREGRWEIPKRHVYYSLLARSLVPGVEARLLVANGGWVAEHGEPVGTEQIWSVEVGSEQIVSHAQMTAAALRRREDSDPWWALALV